MEKNTNKKIITIATIAMLIIGIPAMAALLTYYGTMSATVNVEQSLYLENDEVNLSDEYNYVIAPDTLTCTDSDTDGKLCTATIDMLNGKAVIFRVDVVNKLQNDINWDRLITVSNTDGVSDLVAGEVFVSYAYPANWERTVDSIGAVDGCWESANYGSGSDAYFRTAIGNELPTVIVGAYDGHENSSSQPNGYEMCVEHTESTSIDLNGDLVWNGGNEGAYGIGRCNTLEPVNDNIGCMAGEVSYDRPSYIIVEFPLETVGSYKVDFSMVPK